MAGGAKSEAADAKRAKYVAKVRKAYRDGELTCAQADALRAAGVNLDRFQPNKAGVNDLATKRPDLATEWHPTKNGDLKPTDVTAGSEKKAWWRHQVEDGSWHEWQAKVCDRTGARSSGCPYCANRKVLAGFNDLATKRPDLAAEWHPAKNGDLEPSAILAGSHRKFWWRHWCDKTQS